MRHFLLIIVFFAGLLPMQAQDNLIEWSLDQLRLIQERQIWVDSVYTNMTDDERIAQLFMVAAYSNKDEAHVKEIEKLITDHKIGGLIFMQGGPYRQVKLVNHYQSLAQTKLLISTDAEWGLAMRLKDSTMAFPYQLTLGAIQNEKLIYNMGLEAARQLQRVGVHVSFSPVVDVNNNPNNPVINFRSFGEDKYNVALKGLAYMEGLQDGGVMACAKHFPGHGDTDSDSHLTLPIIKHSRERLEELELYPFKILINNGVKSVMAAHLFIPSLDSTKNQATSLSRKVTTDMLKNELGFKGLVFSDALNMKGVSQYYKQGEVALKAFLAGNDVLLFAEDVPKGIQLIKAALKDGRIKRDEFEYRVKNLLSAKFDQGLTHFDSLSLEGLYEDLHTPQAWLLNRELYGQALTLAANTGDYIPVKALDKNFASLSIGASEITLFQQSLNRYAKLDNYQVSKEAGQDKLKELENKLAQYETVFVGIHDMSQYASKGYGINATTRSFLENLSKKTRVVLVLFGNPYSLKYFDYASHVLVAYQENELTQELAAEALFGAREIKGQLPITASTKYKFGTGIITESLGRLQYTIPEAVGLNHLELQKIDSIALSAITNQATPGCQILVAKEGQVIYYKSFGHHTYDSVRAVQNNDLYDLASITKVGATTLSLMKLYDERQLQLNRRLSDYYPPLDTTNLKNLVVRDVLAHKSGLKSWIPFYLRTVEDTALYKVCYKTEGDSIYCLPVNDALFMREDYKDSVIYIITHTELNKKKEYVYSDLGFILFNEVIGNITGTALDKFADSIFYRPLGLSTMGFNPLEEFPLDRIVPTEEDKVFRKGLVHGYVHDPAAAMFGGVSGHAGLFSDANDLAIMFQMLLNRGSYGGVQYLEPKTVDLFTKKNDDASRRGLGFDKPEPDKLKPGPTSINASMRSYGHSGFTGTCVWADPEHELIYIFLSNRINPTADNRKLISENIRTEIHQVLYDAILKSEQNPVASEK